MFKNKAYNLYTIKALWTICSQAYSTLKVLKSLHLQLEPSEITGGRSCSSHIKRSGTGPNVAQKRTLATLSNCQRCQSCLSAAQTTVSCPRPFPQWRPFGERARGSQEQGSRRVLLKSNRRCPGSKQWANAKLGRRSRGLNNVGGEEPAWEPNSKCSEVEAGTQAKTMEPRIPGPKQGRQLSSRAYLGCLSTLPQENLLHLPPSGSSLLP